jgi:serine/threonine protein kinase
VVLLAQDRGESASFFEPPQPAMVRSSCKLAVNCLAFLRLSHAEDYTPTVDFKLARVSVGQRLGVGSYGEVFTGLLDGERDVVLKRPRGSGIISRRFFRAEVHACRRLRRCRGVAPFLGVAGADAYLVWEDIGLTTLEDVLKCRRPGPAAQEGLTEALQLPDSVSAAVAVKTLAKRLIAACAAVHAASFVHRDVKPANCLLAADGGVRLIDLGAAADMGTRLFFDPDEAVCACVSVHIVRYFSFFLTLGDPRTRTRTQSIRCGGRQSSS